METIEQVVIPYMLEYEKYFNDLELWRQMVSSSVEKRPPPPRPGACLSWPGTCKGGPGRETRLARAAAQAGGCPRAGGGSGGGEEGAESSLRGPPISCSHTSS